METSLQRGRGPKEKSGDRVDLSSGKKSEARRKACLFSYEAASADVTAIYRVAGERSSAFARILMGQKKEKGIDDCYSDRTLGN
jgi:hypothetical protein